MEFIVLGCDGIYDRLENNEIIKIIQNSKNGKNFKDIHEFSGRAVEILMR